MKTETLKQKVLFKAAPEEVYDMLMDEKKHAKFTGDTAKISAKVGGTFKVWGDYITGKNLELKPGKKIVQEWHAADWEAEHISKATFIFKRIKTGTEMSFTHEGIPEELFGDTKQGWEDYYWAPMKAMLKK